MFWIRLLLLISSASCYILAPGQHRSHFNYGHGLANSLEKCVESSSVSENDIIVSATETLMKYDAAQTAYYREHSDKFSMGTSSLMFLRNMIKSEDKIVIRDAVIQLVKAADCERAQDSSMGRVMLGICAENVNEALAGLKLWVGSLELPRGLLHGMDVDGVPVELEGAVYVKYSTGGAMTFSEMRRTGRGFDALWKPGDAVLESYDGDYRGIYFNIELKDGIFRQFGVLPTDLFIDDDDDDDEW